MLERLIYADWENPPEVMAFEAPLAELMVRVAELLPGTAVVSVGHRSSLQAYHDSRLVLHGDGSWDLLDLTENRS